MFGVRPKSPIHDDERAVGEAAPLEIVEERAHRRVERAHQLLRATEDVLVRVPAVERDLDEANARRDEARRGEAASPERRVAVRGAHRLGLLGRVEGLERARVHQAIGLVVELPPAVDLHVAGLRGEAESSPSSRLLRASKRASSTPGP